MSKPSRSESRRQRRRRIIQFVALALVICVHGWGRVQAAKSTPLETRTFYARDYHVALAIMLGRGFELLRLDTPASQPLLDFTMLESERLDPADLAAFDRADRLRPADEPDSRNLAHWNELSRAFDMYVAAGFWSIFGIDWRVHTAFYIGVSMLCGLLVFFITRRISGSFGCGLLAATILALLPYEARYTVLSVRDISALWSTIIAYWAVVCLADRFRSAWLNGASYVATGILATVGLGWRPDAAMLAPVIITTLVAMMIWNRRSWRRIVAAVLLFVVGVKATTLLIGVLLPGDAPPRGAFQVLHVAYYADATRSNMLEQENSFQTLRHDDYVFTIAREFYEQDPIEERAAWDLKLHGPVYSDLMVRAFRDMACYHAFDWAIAFPGVCYNALASVADPDRTHFARFHWWLPCAAVAGGLLGLIAYRRQGAAVLSIFCFWIFYGVLYLVVLPEDKHLSPFVLPLVVLAALGLWLPVRLLGRRSDEAKFKPPFRFRRRWVVTMLLVVVVGLTGTVIGARRLAQSTRQDYLAAVTAAEPAGTDARHGIADPRVFAVTAEFAIDEQRGYLLEIVAGERPGDLVLRVGPEADGAVPGFETRHALEPGARQRFFWSCYRGWLRSGNERSLYSVRLTGDAEIVDARELDLGAWSRLPFATVFGDDDTYAGSPRLVTGPAVRFVDPAGARDEWGLTSSEAFVTTLGPPSRIVAGRDDPVCRAEPVAGSEVRVEPDGLRITTSPSPGRYTAQFGVFTAPERGRYLFRLETHVARGDYVFGLLSGDQSHWMTLAGTADDIVAGGEARIVLCDLDEGEGVVPTLSNPAEAGTNEFVLRGLEIRRLETE